MIDRSGQKKLEKLLRGIVEQGARTGAKFVRESSSKEGSGEQHENLPNPSSLPGEYPAIQTGRFVRSIQMRKESFLSANFGSVNASQAIMNLEFFPESMGGRKPLLKAANDPELHEAILTAIRKLVL